MNRKVFLLAILLMSLCFVAKAQIVGTCTDMNIEAKILRCIRSGEKCILDGIIENVGAKDISWRTGNWKYVTVLYDDMGNQYSVKSATVANVEDAYYGTFPSQIPIKIRLEVKRSRILQLSSRGWIYV